MSVKHPIISITGSSGAGTSSVKQTFDQIFRREGFEAASIEGDAFHYYNRVDMKKEMAAQEAKGNKHFSHFGPDANLLSELANTFKTYGETGNGLTRHYIHDESEAELYGKAPGEFTDWDQFPDNTDLLFYEGLHGSIVHGGIDVAKHADLRVGVVPVINLEWIQKIHRDRAERGYSTEAVMDVILRRMPDYTRYIVPQFAHTNINFQRVPIVDTSDPFIARWIPTADESMVVIRFAKPQGIDFPYLLSMIHDSFMSRANSIVVPGGKMELAMQLIFTPMIQQLMDKKRRTGG